jgi:enoyl-CoA hydratase/carnithine racemase
MDMILTGGTMKSAEAEAAGLVAKIFDDEETVTRAIETGEWTCYPG